MRDVVTTTSTAAATLARRASWPIPAIRAASRYLDPLRRSRGQRVRPALLPEVPGPGARRPARPGAERRARHPQRGSRSRCARSTRRRASTASASCSPRACPAAGCRQAGRGALRARGPAGDAARRPRLRGAACIRSSCGWSGYLRRHPGAGITQVLRRQQRRAPGGLRLALLDAPPQRAGQSHREPARDRGLPRPPPELGAARLSVRVAHARRYATAIGSSAIGRPPSPS